MARYACSTVLATSAAEIEERITRLLQACDLELLLRRGDYLLARERPGCAPLAQMVTLEVLMDRTAATDSRISVQFICKNEELPLQARNHCWQVFERVTSALEQNSELALVELARTE
jgi:hypothetical protein